MNALVRAWGMFSVELSLFAVIFWADWAGFIPLSKTPLLLLVAWASLALRGVTWRSAGFAFPAQWLRLALIGLVAGAAMWALEFFGTQNVLYALTGELPDLHEFDALVGNLTLLLILLGLNIVFAAIGEELVWRGYALPRVAALFGGHAWSWVAALVLVNVAFGMAHLYQGPPGVVENIIAGMLLGALYWATGRNLVAPMFAHFTSNTIDLTTMYLGLYPGVGP